MNYTDVNHRVITFLYIISMTISYTTRFADFTVNRIVRMSIGGVWILYAVIKFAYNNFNWKSTNASIGLWMIKSYLLPSIILHAWTIFLMIIGKLSWEYFTTNVTVYIPTMVAITSIYLFGKKAFKYNVFSLICSYFITVMSSVIVKGWLIIPSAIMEAYFNIIGVYGFGRNYLEVHDAVFAIGFVVIYYFFSIKKITSKSFWGFVFAIAIMLLGKKRIAVLGIMAVLCFKIINDVLPRKIRKMYYFIVGIVIFIACYVFVYLLVADSGIWNIISDLGINLMGRNYYWAGLAERVEFSPGFLGLGRNYSYKLFSEELSYMKVGGAHCDVLKMYAESGFLFFGYWLWHYLIHMVKRYKDKYSNKAALFYLEIAIYLFALYFTDNVETYYTCIVFSIIVPMSYALKTK